MPPLAQFRNQFIIRVFLLNELVKKCGDVNKEEVGKMGRPAFTFYFVL
jgi:hypothetical protein